MTTTIYNQDDVMYLHENDDYDNESSSSNFSEYECDISSRSLHSYSSCETFSDSDMCYKDMKFHRMTTLEQDFQMIEKLFLANSVDYTCEEKECSDDMSDELSTTSDSTSHSENTPKIVPWLQVQKTEKVLLTSIIENESVMTAKAASLEASRKKKEEEAAVKRQQQYNNNQRYNNNKKKPSYQKHDDSATTTSSGSGSSSRRNHNNNHSNHSNHNHNTEPPRRRSLLLSKNDPEVSSSSSPSHRAHDTASVKSDPNASDNSRICKFGNKCVHKTKCGRAHTYDEWEPRKCRFVTSCKMMSTCRYIHSKESKAKYLARMIDMEETFYNKNREMYIKNFKIT